MSAALTTNAGMRAFLNDLFGCDAYIYDGIEDCWIACDRDYNGSGRGFIVIRRGGSWKTAVIPAAVLQ